MIMIKKYSIIIVHHMLPIILLTKTTAAQNEDALSYHRVRGLYFQAVVFVHIPRQYIIIPTVQCTL